MTTIAGSRMDPTHIQHRSGYTAGPRLEDVAAGRGALGRGHFGADVRWLQTRLNALGARPPLDEDGLFGPKTEAAVQRFQRGASGAAPSGRLDLETLVMLAMRQGWPGSRGGSGRPRASNQAPRFGARPPAGSVPARRLATAPELGGASRSGRSLQADLATEAPPNTGVSPLARVRGAGGDTPADRELADIQARAVASADRELRAGVREQGGRNRGPRVDQYARRSRMRPGEWCGFFVGFNLSEAARASGGEFEGINGLHSMQKARSFFEYRSYTNNRRSTNERLDTLRARHVSEGSARRWMTLSGSGGQRHAAQRNRPHEVFEPSTLPIRAGDVAVFSRGHLGMVESYDRASGRLTTIEGNVGDRVQRKTYDLNDARDRARFEGFGRPARGDFSKPRRPGAGADAGSSSGATELGASERSTSATTATPDSRVRAGEAAVTDAGVSEADEEGGPAVAHAPPGADPETTGPLDGGTEVQTASSEIKAAPERPPRPAPAGPLASLPPRPEGAPTGSEFLARTQNMSRAEREAAILQEVMRGNVPDRARSMRPVTLTGRGADGRTYAIETFVAPEYVEIGSDEDAVRIPMTPATAQRIADKVGGSLPTSKMVDAIYQQADVKVAPQPLPPGSQMMSNRYIARHEAMVDAQVDRAGGSPGALVAGHKKDLVLTNRLETRPDRVAIYGWHQPNGAPIQPLSTLHVKSYSDYSHGVRLVSDRVKVNGEWRKLSDVLRDPNLARILSSEGPMRVTRVP